MAKIVLGIGTSHTPLLSLPAERWAEYAQGDQRNPELCYPPHGWAMPYQEGLEYVSPEIKAKFQDEGPFTEWAARCQRALDELSDTLRAAKPDITVVISDDQDEWFFESNMPAMAVYWGESLKVEPRKPAWATSDLAQLIAAGYGDTELDVPVPSAFGRFVVEYLTEHDFDIAQFNYLDELHGGRVARRYPTRTGELDHVRETEPRPQGLPHGFAFIVKRLFRNEPSPILPVFQNTCYPPNQPTPRRSFALGQALAGAIAAWQEPARVAVVASGGLSHFVVDEELDQMILGGLARRDADGLRSVPRCRLYSAASESLNWIALGGALQDTELEMELVDYVPVYRTPAGTGGGWAFARWCRGGEPSPRHLQGISGALTLPSPAAAGEGLARMTGSLAFGSGDV
ncbi:MAG TPA: hypothetical protein VKU60_20810 [Chloroflexota bacterium]|nr:hypothetical protein [Chloroflexota bacterium]